MLRVIWGFFRGILPNPKPSKFDGSYHELLEYAVLCSDMYDTESSLKKKYPNALITTMKETEVMYMVQKSKDTYYITIRGTANIKNIAINAYYTKTKAKKIGIYLHSGFNDAAFKMYEDLILDMDPGSKVIISGHSLGGALAVVLGMYLKKAGFKVPKIVTFGQPKVTNHKGMWKYRRLPLIRVIHDNDPVPTLPPETFVSSFYGIYEHIGPELLLKNDGSPPVYYDRHAAQAKDFGAFWANIDSMDIKDHYPNGYIQRLRECTRPPANHMILNSDAASDTAISGVAAEPNDDIEE